MLCDAGIVAGPSNRAEDIQADPHVQARNMLIEVPRPDAERPYLAIGNPVKMSGLAEGPVGAFHASASTPTRCSRPSSSSTTPSSRACGTTR